MKICFSPQFSVFQLELLGFLTQVTGFRNKIRSLHNLVLVKISKQKNMLNEQWSS